MSDIQWKGPARLPYSWSKSKSSSTPDIREQQAPATSTSSAEGIAPLEGAPAANVESPQLERTFMSNPKESTTGAQTINSRTDPNVTSLGGVGADASALHAGDVSKEIRSVANASFMSPLIPYALKWTKHEMDLRQEGPSNDSEAPGMTPNVFPRWNHICIAIPNSVTEFVIVGGHVNHEDSVVQTDDLILLSTIDMSFTRLQTSGEKLPTAAGHRAVFAGRVLIAFGGPMHSYLYILNLDSREWFRSRPPAPYPSPRWGHSFHIVDGTIWLYGGGMDGSTVNDMWCIDLATSGIEFARWRQVSQKDPWPKPRAYHSTVYYNGCLYIFGGMTTDGGGLRPKLNDLWKFEIRTETWTEIECGGLVPLPRDGHAAAVVGDNMFMFGGFVPGEGERAVATDHAFVLSFRDYTWKSLAMFGSSPGPANAGVLLASGSQLVLVGGQTYQDQCIYVAETHTASSVRGSLPTLQFMTETTKLKFTSDAVDLSRFVRKQGTSPHSLAGFSDVWKGEMTETGKPIAIKVLRVTKMSNEDDPESGRLRIRFDRELTIWMECQHPRVLELLGYAYIEGVPCLISPWCSNGNILEYLSQNPNADRRQLINQVAEGLVYLHGRKPPVVHSDIKPANVLVSDEGTTKLCDFGISKLVLENPSGFTTTTSVKGTLRYSSLEMLDLDGQTTTRSDVWAFGMLILHIMTTKVPYVTILSDAKVVMAIMNGQKPLPADYSELPATDPLWDLMHKCWHNDPMKRPTMAEAFAKASRVGYSPTTTTARSKLPDSLGK